MESFGVGGIPQQLMDAFAAGLGHYETTHKVLIMTTQVTYEGSDVGVYEVGNGCATASVFWKPTI